MPRWKSRQFPVRVRNALNVYVDQNIVYEEISNFTWIKAVLACGENLKTLKILKAEERRSY
jgi:hypothetical protein